MRDETTERTVWVVNDCGHDYSPGAKYGRLRSLTKGAVNIFSTKDLLDELKNTLADSNPEDILMYSGGPVRIAVLASHVMLSLHGVVNELIFGHTKGEYTKREFTRSDVEEGLNQIGAKHGHTTGNRGHLEDCGAGGKV